MNETGLLASSLSLLEIAIFVVFAAIGGSLGYCMRAVGKKEKIEIGRVVLEFACAGFLGVITVLFCRAVQMDWIWSGVVVGLFSWVGVDKTVAMLTNAVKRQLLNIAESMSKGGKDGQP